MMKLGTIWSAYQEARLKAEHALEGRNTVMSPIQACELNVLYRKRMRQQYKFADRLIDFIAAFDEGRFNA